MLDGFTKEVFITFTTRVLEMLFGVVISIIIARGLGPIGKGTYSLAILLPGLLLSLMNLGINPATVFFTAKNKYPLNQLFGNNILLSFLISIMALSVAFVIIHFFSNQFFHGVKQEYLLLSLLLIPLPLLFDSTSHILIGVQNIKIFNFICFIQRILFFLFVFILYLSFHLDILGAIVAQIFSFLLSGIILFHYTLMETKGISFRTNRNYIRDVFSYGSKAHLGGIINFLHFRIDIFLINIFLNPQHVGFYTVAVSLAEGMWIISRSVGVVFFPKIASETDEVILKNFTPLVFRCILLIAMFLGLILFIVSDRLIIILYSDAFIESVQPFRILLIGVVALSARAILTYFFLGTGRPMLNTYICAVSLIINILLNIIFVPKWGVIGASWATTFSYSLMFFITLLVYWQISGNNIKNIIIPQKSDILYLRERILSTNIFRFYRK